MADNGGNDDGGQGNNNGEGEGQGTGQNGSQEGGASTQGSTESSESQTDAEATQAAAEADPQVSPSVEAEHVKDVAPDSWMAGRLGLTPEHFAAVTARALGRENLTAEQISATLDQAKDKFGFNLSPEAQAKAVNVGIMEKGAIDYAKSLPTTTATDIVAEAKAAYDRGLEDMTAFQRATQPAFSEKGALAKAEAFVADREKFKDSILTGRMADVTEKSFKDTMDLATNFGAYQPGQVAQAQFGGYSPADINKATATGIGDIVGALATTSPVNAIGVIGKSLSKDLEGKLAFDKLANPLGQAGIFGKAAEVAASFLGPFAAPAKMGIQAIGMITGPAYTDFSKSPSFSSPAAADGNGPVAMPVMPTQAATPQTQPDVNQLLEKMFGKTEQNPTTIFPF